MRVDFNLQNLGTTALKWVVDTMIGILVGVPVPLADFLSRVSVDTTKEFGYISGKLRFHIQEAMNSGLEQYGVACQMYDEMDWRRKRFLDHHDEYTNIRKRRKEYADILFQHPIKNMRRIRALKKMNNAADREFIYCYIVPLLGFFLNSLPRYRLNTLFSRVKMYIGRRYGIGVLCAIRNKHLSACNGNPIRLFSLAIQDIGDDNKFALIESTKRRRTVYSFAVCDVTHEGEGGSIKVLYEIEIPRVLRKSIDTWRRSVRNSPITGMKPVFESPTLFYINVPRKYIRKGYPDGGHIEWYNDREIHREMAKDDDPERL